MGKNLFIVLCLVLCLPFTVVAETLPWAEEFVQDGITWNYYTQDAPDYLLPKNEKCAKLICRTIPSLRDVVVPAEVNGLPVVHVRFGDNGLGNVNGYIRSVTFPASVRYVQCLDGTATLKWIRMTEPSPWHEVSYSFQNCTALTNAVVCDLPSSAFEGCKTLRDVSILGRPEKLGYRAFWGCERLETVKIPNSCTNWSLLAFKGCKCLKNVNVPEGVCELISAFPDCQSLTSIRLPESIQSLSSVLGESSGCFGGCGRLTDINFPKNLQGIGSDVFSGCAFTEVDIPGNVKKIHGGAFASNLSLTNVVLREGVQALDALFGGCKNLRRVVLPASLENIISLYYGYKGPAASEDCLLGMGVFPDEIVVPESSPYFEMVDGMLVQKYASPKTIKWVEWGLTDVVLPEGIVRVPSYLFYGLRDGCCYPISSVVIPEGVQVVGSGAFSYCANLTTVVFPATLTDIERGAFFGTAISDITLPESLEYIRDDAFNDCDNLRCIVVPASVVEVGDDSFYADNYLDVCVFKGDVPYNVTRSGLLRAWHIYYPREYADNYRPLVDESRFAGYTESIPANPTMAFRIEGEQDFDVSRKGCGVIADAWPADPQKEGREFLGWFTDPVGGTLIDRTIVLTENIVCYAHFSNLPPLPEDVAIRLNANGGMVSPSELSLMKGAEFGMLPIPEWAGHEFWLYCKL